VNLYDRPGPQIVAAVRLLGVAPAPRDATQLAALDGAADAARMRVVTLADGITLIRDPDTDGLWGSPELAGARAKGPATDKLQMTLAACLRLCWDDLNAPMLPGKTVTRAQIVELTSRLRFADRGGALGGFDAHVVGAVRTLTDAGYLSLDDGNVRLGYAMSTWTARDIATLRGAWDRFPNAEDVA
jgi:hypothetical protein